MAQIGTRESEHERFWELAEPHLASGRLVEGTMMGHQCLRSASTNGFVATVARASGNVVAKLPAARNPGFRVASRVRRPAAKRPEACVAGMTAEPPSCR